MKLMTLFSILLAADGLSFGADGERDERHELFPKSPPVPVEVKVKVVANRLLRIRHSGHS
jgi:hypothetical protein